MQKSVYEFISKQTNDPIVEWKKCKRCDKDFAITQREQDALEKISPTLEGEKSLIPFPKLCPDCRLMRKMMFRNERKLYRRKCDATGKMMVSMFHPQADVVAYDSKIWNGESWIGEDYKQEIDLDKNIFDQLHILSKKVPKRILANAISLENCEYSNYGIDSKDCYLSAGVAFSEKCHYSYTPIHGLQDMDGYVNMLCQYVYDCVECFGCYKCYYCLYAVQSKNSYLLFDCTNCEECFGCVNLVGKKYCFFNEQLSPEEYKNKVESITGSNQKIQNAKKKFEVFKKQFPRKTTRNINVLGSYGNNISNSENCINCFTVLNAQNCKNNFICGEKSTYLFDCYQAGGGSNWLYESTGCTRGYKSAFIFGSDPINSYYTEWTIDQGGSSNLFLCSGLRHKKYHIFNKEYSPQEREKNVKKVIKKMEIDGQWGEFFPPWMGPYPLNDSPAMEYFPVKKIIDDKGGMINENSKGKGTITLLEPEKFISEAILDLGGEEKIKTTWRTKEIDVAKPEGLKTISAQDLPDHISDVDDSILDKAILCEVSGRPFKIIKQELEFYRTHNLPLPRKHYEIRHLERLHKTPGLHLYLRNCDKCTKEIVTAYGPDSGETVYCEECYNKEMY